MNAINSNKLGLALGATGVLLYLGCMLLMLVAGQNGTTLFFNTVLHGLDVSTISRMNVPAAQSIVGILLTFGMGWITGFLTGSIYNWIER